jgi:alcohol dehydrogenase (cytochrome c)
VLCVHDASKSGWLTAIDVRTGIVRWRYHAPTPMLSGVTSTAGGIVLSADLNGNLIAFDDATGKILTTVPLGAAVGGGIITYATAGKQFVAVAAGLSSPLFETPQTETSIVVLGL